MSECQYYEFQAIDRPLTKSEMAEVRALSTRATITSTRFQNEYHWGDFTGDPLALIARYYDAHVYDTLAPRWRQVEGPIELERAREYDEATRLLTDLRDLSARQGTSDTFRERPRELRLRHAKKPSFLERLDRAGLPR